MSTRYASDYAKRVSNCKKCKLQLPKGCLRLAKITPNPFVDKADGPPPDMKSYFHPNCLFETFYKARATTKVVEEAGDVEGWGDLKDEDKDDLTKLIDDLSEVRGNKAAGKTPKKTAASEKASPPKPSSAEKKKEGDEKDDEPKKKDSKAKKADKKEKEQSKEDLPEVKEDSKYNLFYKFCQLCDVIGSLSKYTDKSKAVNLFVTKDKYDGDIKTLIRLLLPGTDQRVYNLKEKQILKHFAKIYDINYEELTNLYKLDGDASRTIRTLMEQRGFVKKEKSDWSIQKIDRWLTRLTTLTKDDEQSAHFKFATKRLSGLEIMYLVRLVKKDLRINAGTKHILEGLHEKAYDTFQHCRDIDDLLKKYSSGELTKINNSCGGIKLGSPVLPMLAEPCKSVAQAMRKCPNGMYAEIKYDGERVQVHKTGDKFTFYSRSLKPVQNHKIEPFESFIPEAFVDGTDLILDAEVLMVDVKTGKPLPFGSLGIHKREKFKEAVVCLFVFDILRYNDEDLTSTPLQKRREFLEKTMVEVPNRIVLSNYQHIENGDNDKLQTLIWKAIDEGLEGLVLKDVEGKYEPGKRYWLKVKKDYLEQGQMADSADLIVLGGYFGSGNKGGVISIFLMGVYDVDTKTYKTVTKCGNGHTDEGLEKINSELKDKMTRVDGNYTNLPAWLNCSRAYAPDFVIKNPEEGPVWEITGAEFSKSSNHSADGLSIRFPRVTRIREDKNWETATTLAELKNLYKLSKTKCDVERNLLEDEKPLYVKETVKESKNEGDSNKRKSNDADDSESDAPSAKKRKNAPTVNTEKVPCQYGADCYRKNPQHKEEYSHPV